MLGCRVKVLLCLQSDLEAATEAREAAEAGAATLEADREILQQVCPRCPCLPCNRTTLITSFGTLPIVHSGPRHDSHIMAFMQKLGQALEEIEAARQKERQMLSQHTQVSTPIPHRLVCT